MAYGIPRSRVFQASLRYHVGEAANGVGAKWEEAKLPPLQVYEDTDGVNIPVFDLSDCGHPPSVILMGAMTEVEPKHSDPGFIERSDRFR